MKKSYWPNFQINTALVDLLFKSSLMSRGITDARSYFRVFSSRIICSVSVCAVLGAVMGGAGGILGGVLAGMVMPLFLIYFSIIGPMILAQLVGLILGVLWVMFCLWVLFKMITW